MENALSIEMAALDNPATTPTAISPLHQSLNDAEILVNYAIRNNITGMQEAISSIAVAREQFAAGNLKGDNQRAFYAYYSALAAGVWPVSVASLKDSLDEYGMEVKDWFFFGRPHMLSRAGIVARRQSILATFVLLALVVAQSYWLIGNTFIQAVPPRTAEETEAIRRAWEDIRADFDLRDQASAPAPISVQNQAQTNAPSPSHISADQLKASAEKASAATKVVNQFEMENVHRNQITRMLAAWAWYFPMPINLDQATSTLGFYGPRENMPPEAVKRAIDWYPAVDRVYTVCGRILDILQQYVLPLLYGLLGATAYVIRTISQQARDRLYRAENETGYYLRIWLGVLGGLAIGWFIKPTGGAVGAISPLALAFVAGYSVDLLFTAMDRIVSAFSAPEEQKERPEPAMK